MLPPGARIAVVAPSGVYDPARLDRGLDLLRAWGYHPEPMPGLGRTFRYLAGEDEVRLEDLVAAFSGGADAVWMARGGYGIGRLLRRLPFDDLRPVPFLGFSDGTALLNPLHDRGLPAVHAPVLHSLADHCDAESRERLRRLLAGDAVGPLRGEALIPGDADGDLVGGNLCVLASLCGTPWQLRGAGRIVLLEEVGEVPYRVDRMLTQLVEAGCLDGVRGIALGEFLGAAPPPGARWTLRDVLLDRLAPLGVPVVAGLPVGHGPANHAFRLGPARLHVDLLETADTGSVA